MIQPENSTLVDRFELFVVAQPETAAHFDPAPFGVPITHRFDPLHTGSRVFLDLLENLDRATFGPEGMPMPRWVYLAGSALTGAIAGLAVPADRASPALRELLGVARGYHGPVPLSVYIAIPAHEKGVWFGHNLAALTALLPEENLSGLGGLTKALALKTYRARQQVGATQWSSRALYVHTRMGRLSLETTFTPAHGDDDTLTYRAECSDEVLLHLARQRGAQLELPEPTAWMLVNDVPQMRALQRRIENGTRVALVGRPRSSEMGTQVPLWVDETTLVDVPDPARPRGEHGSPSE